MKTFQIVIQGFYWGAGGIVIKSLLQVVFMATMARLLTPTDFGVMALVGLSLKFFQYFAQSGVAPSLIQKKSVNNRDISTALFLTLVMSTVLYLVLGVFSDSISQYFQVGVMSPLLKLVGFNLYIMSLSGLCVALLQRAYKFKTVSVIELFSYTFGYGFVGIVSATNGAGVWSLAYAQLAQSTLMLCLSYSKLQFPIKIKYYSENAKTLISYGARFTVVGFLEFLASIIVPTLMGKFLGAAAIGNFDRAFLIAHLPIQQPSNLVNSMFFPILSSNQNSVAKFQMYFKITVLVLGIYTITYSIFMQLYSDIVIHFLLGEKWIDAIPILKLLALTIPPIYVTSSLMVLFNSSKNLGARFAVTLSGLVIFAIGIFYMYPIFEVASLVYLVLIVSLTRLILTIGFIVYLFSVSIRSVFTLCIIMSVYYLFVQFQVGLFNISHLGNGAGYQIILYFFVYFLVTITSFLATVPFIKRLNLDLSLIGVDVRDDKFSKFVRYII